MVVFARKDILVIAAVLAVALESSPLSAKDLAKRLGLSFRRLEPVLQALVRDRILIGVRGPRGGYAIARDASAITAEDILRSTRRADEISYAQEPSEQLELVGRPALMIAQSTFYAALRQITLSGLIQDAQIQESATVENRIGRRPQVT